MKRFLLTLAILFNLSLILAQTNWSASNTGLPANSFVNDFAQVSNGDIYTAINAGGQGYLYKSTDNGDSWSNVPVNGLPVGAWAGSFYENNGLMFVGLGGWGDYLYKSTDNGLNWTVSNTGLPANSFVNGFAQVSNGDVYTAINAGGQGYLYKSTDNGNSWSNVSVNGLPAGAWAGSFYENNGIMFVGLGGWGDYLYKSTDNGLNWTISNTGLPANSFVNGFAQVLNGDIYTAINAGGQGYLYKSTDNGNSWSNVSVNGLPIGAWAGSFYENNGLMFIGLGGWDQYLYKSGTTTNSLNEDNFFDVSVYPLPSTGIINIESTEIIECIIINDQNGRTIQKINPNSNKSAVELFNSGIYYMHVLTESNSFVRKIMVE